MKINEIEKMLLKVFIYLKKEEFEDSMFKGVDKNLLRKNPTLTTVKEIVRINNLLPMRSLDQSLRALEVCEVIENYRIGKEKYFKMTDGCAEIIRELLKKGE